MNNGFIVSTCPNINFRDWAFWKSCTRDSTMAFKGACDSSLWNQDCPWSISSFLSVIFHFPRPCFPYPCTWQQHLITGQLHHGSPVASCQMIWICFKVVSLHSLGLLISVQASQIAWLYHTVRVCEGQGTFISLFFMFSFGGAVLQRIIVWSLSTQGNVWWNHLESLLGQVFLRQTPLKPRQHEPSFSLQEPSQFSTTVFLPSVSVSMGAWEWRFRLEWQVRWLPELSRPVSLLNTFNLESLAKDCPFCKFGLVINGSRCRRQKTGTLRLH